jgi:hypothetical protein
VYTGGKERQSSSNIRQTPQRVTEIKIYGDRTTMVKLNGELGDRIIQIYTPTTEYDDDEVEAMYEQLEESVPKRDQDQR